MSFHSDQIPSPDHHPPNWRTPRTCDSEDTSTVPEEADSLLAGGDCGARVNPPLDPGERVALKRKPATNNEPTIRKEKPKRKNTQQKLERCNQPSMETMTLEEEQRHHMTYDYITYYTERNTDAANFRGNLTAALAVDWTYPFYSHKISCIRFSTPSFIFRFSMFFCLLLFAEPQAD